MAENKKITTIEDYVDNLSPEQREICEYLRNLVKKTVPQAEEKIMWSSPWYLLNGKYLVWMGSAKDHFNFGFAYGANLKSDLLEGTGKNMRHVKVKNMEDLREKEEELIRLLKEAEKLTNILGKIVEE